MRKEGGEGGGREGGKGGGKKEEEGRREEGREGKGREEGWPSLPPCPLTAYTSPFFPRKSNSNSRKS